MFAIAPRNLLHHDSPAVAALDTPHHADKQHGRLPQRYEFESPCLRKMVVHEAFANAVRPRGAGTLSRANVDGQNPAIFTQRHVFAHVTIVFLAPRAGWIAVVAR